MALISNRRLAAMVGVLVLTALAVSGCATTPQAAVTPTATDVWIKAVPKIDAMDMTGMFGVFSNSSDEVIYIVGGQASDAGLTGTKLDAHEVIKDANGKMVMQEVKTGIPIPAHGSVTLKPGSYHIMLWNLEKPIVAGDKVSVTLQFSNGTSLQVAADARDIANYAG